MTGRKHGGNKKTKQKKGKSTKRNIAPVEEQQVEELSTGNDSDDMSADNNETDHHVHENENEHPAHETEHPAPENETEHHAHENETDHLSATSQVFVS